jgi:hypothetical protein
LNCSKFGEIRRQEIKSSLNSLAEIFSCNIYTANPIKKILYTIALCTLHVHTCLKWYEKLFRERGGARQIVYSFSYIIFLIIYLFIIGVKDLLLSN